MHRAVGARGERQACVFLQRQGIHIAAQKNGAAIGGSAQQRDKSRRRRTLDDLEWQSGERSLCLLGGLGCHEAQFRFFMDGAPERDHIGQLSAPCLDPFL